MLPGGKFGIGELWEGSGCTLPLLQGGQKLLGQPQPLATFARKEQSQRCADPANPPGAASAGCAPGSPRRALLPHHSYLCFFSQEKKTKVGAVQKFISMGFKVGLWWRFHFYLLSAVFVWFARGNRKFWALPLVSLTVLCLSFQYRQTWVP